MNNAARRVCVCEPESACTCESPTQLQPRSENNRTLRLICVYIAWQDKALQPEEIIFKLSALGTAVDIPTQAIYLVLLLSQGIWFVRTHSLEGRHAIAVCLPYRTSKCRWTYNGTTWQRSTCGGTASCHGSRTADCNRATSALATGPRCFVARDCWKQRPYIQSANQRIVLSFCTYTHSLQSTYTEVCLLATRINLEWPCLVWVSIRCFSSQPLKPTCSKTLKKLKSHQAAAGGHRGCSNLSEIRAKNMVEQVWKLQNL